MALYPARSVKTQAAAKPVSVWQILRRQHQDQDQPFLHDVRFFLGQTDVRFVQLNVFRLLS